MATTDSSLAQGGTAPPSPATAMDVQQSLACYRVISQTPFALRLYKGGRLLKLKAIRTPATRKPPPAQWLDNARASSIHTHQEFEVPESGHYGRPPRGKVHGFSQASRMRLLEKFNMLDASHCTPRPKFITLTYPEELCPDWETAKRQLNTFLWYLEKRYGRHGLMWRMEHQENGSIHFHILFWYQKFVPWEWVAQGWDGLIGNYVLPKESASTNIKGVKGWRQVAYYVSKYVAKRSADDEADVEHGRHWGTRNWHLMPVKVRVIALSAKEGYMVRRMIRGWREAHGVRRHAYTGRSLWVPSSECGISAFAPEAIGWRMVQWATGYSKREYLRAPPARCLPSPLMTDDKSVIAQLS